VRGAALFLLAVSAVACDSILGIPSQETLRPDGSASEGGSGVSPAECNADADTDKCFQCDDVNCCAQYLACQADPRCADYYKTCIPGCKATGASYDACVVQCDKQYGAGHAIFAPYNACGQRHCLAPCSNSPPDGCTSCLYSACADQATACVGDRECDTLFNCLTTCNSQTNADQCSAACKAGVSQAAQDSVNTELACAATYCANACGGTLP
jgi:hypothetical protein